MAQARGRRVQVGIVRFQVGVARDLGFNALDLFLNRGIARVVFGAGAKTFGLVDKALHFGVQFVHVVGDSFGVVTSGDLRRG